MTTETLIRLYEDTKKPGVCSATSCRAPIDWYRTLKDKGMPMNRGAVPRKSENDPDTKRVIAFFSAGDSHWATCPAATKFGRGRG
jgi:hypothetical protein